MKIVISPAKSLDFTTELPTEQYTQGIFLEKAQKLSNVLKKEISTRLICINENFG